MPVRRLPTDYWRLLQIASRPVSRVLYGRKPCGCRRDGHSSGTPVAGRLEQPTRATGLRTGPARLAARASLLFGFAPGGACLAADVAADAVRSCRTLSPLPAKGRRFAFCGAFPEIALAGRYPAPCPHGARTFLRPKATAVRPTGARAIGARRGRGQGKGLTEITCTASCTPRTGPPPPPGRPAFPAGNRGSRC